MRALISMLVACASCAGVAAVPASAGEIDYIPLSDQDRVALVEAARQSFPERVALNSRLQKHSYGYTREESEGTYAVLRFEPYQTSRGIGEGIVVFCQRQTPDSAWGCESGEVRRYIHNPGDEYPMEVTGLMDYDYVLAAIAFLTETLATDPAFAHLDPHIRVGKLDYFSEEAIAVWLGPDSRGDWHKLQLRVLDDTPGAERFEAGPVGEYGPH